VNEWYWKPKLARTVEGDRKADAALAEAGWTMLRFWEHDHLEAISGKVIETVKRSQG
jgi:DNA mismatch endonuclease (patch repair protein)